MVGVMTALHDSITINVLAEHLGWQTVSFLGSLIHGLQNVAYLCLHCVTQNRWALLLLSSSPLVIPLYSTVLLCVKPKIHTPFWFL